MAQTGERESAVLGTMFVLEKFDISINIGKFVMCVFFCSFFFLYSCSSTGRAKNGKFVGSISRKHKCD